MSRKKEASSGIENQARSPRKALTVTALSFAAVLAAVLFTLVGTRYVLEKDYTWSVSGYTGFSDTVDIPDSRLGLPVTEVSRQAFFLSDLRHVTLGSNVTSLDGFAFYGCAQLESVSLNYGLASINDCCFCDCVSLKRIVIPSTVTYIHASAFNGCSDLVIVAPAGSYAADYAARHGISWEDTTEAFAADGR